MVDTGEHMEARTLGIGELLQQRSHMRVPDHQRDYSWNADDEVEQLLDDVTRAMKESAGEYFLGLVVLIRPSSSDEPWEILDGQQRLATTTMVYAAIRDWLHGNGLDSEAQKVQTKYIGVQELGQPDDRPRITLNINDRQAFDELVVNRRDTKTLQASRDAAGRFSSVRKLIEAALTCREKAAQIAEGAGGSRDDRADRLYALARYLESRAKVVVMQVASTADAYMIFESLNDRGLDLSVLDLVKNHLFGRAGKHLGDVQIRWTKMTASLGDRKADDFLKTFWTSKFGRIQRGRLFEQWRQKYDGLSAADIVKLADDLAEKAEVFSALSSPDHEIWNAHTNATRELVADLAVVGNQQMWPAMMAGLEHYSPDRMEQLLKHLLVLTVRYQTIGRGRTGRLEIAGANLAKGIANGELKSPARAWRAIADLVPSDEDFKIDFARFSETKADRARYLLASLERASVAGDKSAEPELVPWAGLTLEHVLAKNADTGEWHDELKADPDLRQEVARLGNLCLLPSRPGRGVGSKGFKTKSALYEKSALALTREVATYAEWNRASIEDRQKRLAELAVAAWPLPPITKDE
jgi:Protein of unknown function DUF262/Protein of unknown function (DUF1524)